MSTTTSAARAASMRSKANGLPCRRITRARTASGTTYLCMRQACPPRAATSILGEMPFDQRRDFGGVRFGEVVPAAFHDMQPRVGQALREVLPYGQRTDLVIVAPQQQGRCRDALDRQRRRGGRLQDPYGPRGVPT